jgi:hypothetical protein
MSGPNTIILKCNRLSDRAAEARAAGALKPGHLLQHDASGNVVVHATAGGYAEAMFAKEDSFQGKTIDDAYASGDLVQIHRAQKADEIYAFVPAAAAAIILTDFLTSNGDGTVKKAASTDQRLFKPLEALDNSGGGSPARLRIRVL